MMMNPDYVIPDVDALTQEEPAIVQDISGTAIPVNGSSSFFEAYEQICAGLLQSATSAGVVGHRSFELEPGGDLTVLQVVIGVGIGVSESPEELSAGPGEACLHLYTAEPVSKEVALNYAATALGAQALTTGDIPVRAIHTGPIDLLAHRFRMRPSPGGISLGHVNITAGTLGCLCRGRSAPRKDRLLTLSNNHVLAAVNAGKIGDVIVQPGPFDGGGPSDQLGLLERFVNISFTGPNYVDCATAWVNPANVRSDLIYLRSGQPHFFQVSNMIVPARNGMTVGKSGRTTQLTAGRVVATGVSIRVNMGGGRVAQFVDQISISGLSGNFSQGGDSGSLVWT